MTLMNSLFYLALALVATNPAEAAGECDYNFCGGAVTNPTGTVTSISGIQSQCSLVQLGIDLNYVSAADCANLPGQEEICCPAGGSTGGGDSGGSTGQSCFVCGTDKTFNKEKSWQGDKICENLDTSLAAIPAGSICDSTLVAANLMLDLASFCECEGAFAPNTCKVCNDSQDVSTTAMVPNEEGLTCSAAADYASHLKNSTQCTLLVTDDVKATCCVEKDSGAIGLSIRKIAAVLLVGIAFAF